VSGRNRELLIEYASAGEAERFAQFGLGPDGAEHAGAGADHRDGLVGQRGGGRGGTGGPVDGVLNLSTPGIDPLYSGVTNRTASAWRMAAMSLSAPGIPPPVSRSSVSSNGSTAPALTNKAEGSEIRGSSVVEAWIDEYIRFEHRTAEQERLRAEIRARVGTSKRQQATFCTRPSLATSLPRRTSRTW
jgi:hypothetical protein